MVSVVMAPMRRRLPPFDRCGELSAPSSSYSRYTGDVVRFKAGGQAGRLSLHLARGVAAYFT